MALIESAKGVLGSLMVSRAGIEGEWVNVLVNGRGSGLVNRAKCLKVDSGVGWDGR
jgi:hypothetical protein